MCGLDADEVYSALEEVKDFAREKLSEVEDMASACATVAESLERMIDE